MPADFKNSETKENLMRAFAGESMARNRYSFAAGQARSRDLYVISAVFTFTADQEREHAEVFYNLLTSLSGESVSVNGSYPVDISENIASLLRSAQHNEYEEHDDVYRHFAEKAGEEGFTEAAAAFELIAGIEKVHGDRFGLFADLLEQGKLFVAEAETAWMCLNCGHIYRGSAAPALCPVCKHNQGYFIRLELAPYTGRL